MPVRMFGSVALYGRIDYGHKALHYKKWDIWPQGPTLQIHYNAHARGAPSKRENEFCFICLRYALCPMRYAIF